MSFVKSLSVGDGDMFYIRHGSHNFTIIDCCMSSADRDDIVEELRRESAGKSVIRVLSTHPDEDHVRGLAFLDDELGILNFYCVQNEAHLDDSNDDFRRYRELRDSDKAFYLYSGCSRYWLNKTNDECGSSGINIQWPKTSNEDYQMALNEAAAGMSPNNISPIVHYSRNGGVKMLWMGDLETELMNNIEDEVDLSPIDVLFAPHHGRDSGKVPESWLAVLLPKIIVIGEAPAEHLNYYAGYDTITQNSAGDIMFDCGVGQVDIYVSSDSYKVDCLEDYSLSDAHGGYYIGTLEL